MYFYWSHLLTVILVQILVILSCYGMATQGNKSIQYRILNLVYWKCYGFPILDLVCFDFESPKTESRITFSSFSFLFQFTMHPQQWLCMVNWYWKLKLEEVILLSVVKYSKSKQAKTDIIKPEHFRYTNFSFCYWTDFFPCVAIPLCI